VRFVYNLLDINDPRKPVVPAGGRAERAAVCRITDRMG